MTTLDVGQVIPARAAVMPQRVERVRNLPCRSLNSRLTSSICVVTPDVMGCRPLGHPAGKGRGLQRVLLWDMTRQPKTAGRSLAMPPSSALSQLFFVLRQHPPDHLRCRRRHHTFRCTQGLWAARKESFIAVPRARSSRLMRCRRAASWQGRPCHTCTPAAPPSPPPTLCPFPCSNDSDR